MSDVAKTMFISLAVVIAIALARSAWGQDHPGHREGHDWYKHLRNNGVSCCNGDTEGNRGDCRPGAVWRDDKGIVWAIIDGQREIVPPAAVLPDNLNQQPLTGHICKRGDWWFCALVGGSGG